VAPSVRSTSRRMDNDAVLLGNCRNGLDGRHLPASFSHLVEGGEHVIEAGARHRERQETQRIRRAFDFNKHFATQHIERFVLTAMRARWSVSVLRSNRTTRMEK